MKLFIKIWHTKRRAKRLANSLDRRLANSDCGRRLLGEISPSFHNDEIEYNKAIDWLRTNDPAFPKGD